MIEAVGLLVLLAMLVGGAAWLWGAFIGGWK